MHRITVQFWRLSLSVLILTLFVEKKVQSFPVDKTGDNGSISLLDKYPGPVMVPVSSTVIPILHLFGRPKKNVQTSDSQQQKSVRRNSNIYLSPERRARLFERNNRPDVPGRLITKNSKAKIMKHIKNY